MYDTKGILVGSSLEMQSISGFSMAIILDCLHMVGMLFSIKHLLSIASMGTYGRSRLDGGPCYEH